VNDLIQKYEGKSQISFEKSATIGQEPLHVDPNL